MPALLLRLLPWLLGAVALGSALLVVNGWRKDAARLPEVEKNFAVYVTATETSARVRQEVSSGYQSELETLRAAAGRQPAPAVRLCQSPPAVVPTDRAAGGDHGAGTGAGQLPAGTGANPPGGPGPDIGFRLFAEADRADQLAAQLRACQGFVERVRTKPEG